MHAMQRFSRRRRNNISHINLGRKTFMAPGGTLRSADSAVCNKLDELLVAAGDADKIPIPATPSNTAGSRLLAYAKQSKSAMEDLHGLLQLT